MSPRKSPDRPYTVFLLPAANKELQKLPETIQKQISTVIHSLTYPLQVSAITMKSKKNTCRIRTGDYRVLYKIYTPERIVIILKISHRKKAYR